VDVFWPYDDESEKYTYSVSEQQFWRIFREWRLQGLVLGDNEMVAHILAQKHLEVNTVSNKIQIVNYDDKYRQEIIKFITSIAINEFGFYKWKDYLENKSFEPYKKNGGKFWIAIDSHNEIIGTCGALKVSDNMIKLNSLYVKKEYRREKIGTNLYELLLGYAKKEKYKSIILCTYNEFAIAKYFYETRGFKLYEKIDKELWYKKELRYLE
jgi:N-acetylglutamate synthase-like GNAT family acetyltransferase